jgi:hypothetical protein
MGSGEQADNLISGVEHVNPENRKKISKNADGPWWYKGMGSPGFIRV